MLKNVIFTPHFAPNASLPKVGSVRAEARNGGSGAELGPELNSGSSISESIYIYIKMLRDPETILKRVQHRIQGDNIVFPQQILIIWKTDY